MIQVHVHLFGLLREKFPKEARGKADVSIRKNATIRDLLKQLGITRVVTFAVNEEIELDEDHKLQDGDQVEIFRMLAGG